MPPRARPPGQRPWNRSGSRGPLPRRHELDLLVIGRAEDQPLHIDRRHMDAIGVEAADRHDLLDLGDADPAAGRRRLVEVARRLAEHEVARLVGLPALDDAEVGADATLEDIILTLEILHFLA